MLSKMGLIREGSIGLGLHRLAGLSSERNGIKTCIILLREQRDQVQLQLNRSYVGNKTCLVEAMRIEAE